MHTEKKSFQNKAELYESLTAALSQMLMESGDAIADLANASALLMFFLDDLNWAGFYLMKDGALVLGPFQGKPAVVRIEVGKGVCGTAAAARRTQVVADVHKCENHIACDSASVSEIVVPLFRGGELFGVLDIDSPSAARFDEADVIGLEKFAAALMAGLE